MQAHHGSIATRSIRSSNGLVFFLRAIRSVPRFLRWCRLHLKRRLVLGREVGAGVHGGVDLPECRVHDGQQAQAGELAPGAPSACTCRSGRLYPGLCARASQSPARSPGAASGRLSGRSARRWRCTSSRPAGSRRPSATSAASAAQSAHGRRAQVFHASQCTKAAISHGSRSRWRLQQRQMSLPGRVWPAGWSGLRCGRPLLQVRRPPRNRPPRPLAPAGT